MKRILAKLMILILAVCTVGLTACGGSSWKGTTMTNWGEGSVVGGFIGQTSNYVYYINGIGTSSGDNTFGATVKGALMAADKTDLSKTEVVVPKLFVANDYTAGVYIYGDYVYYGTPSTEKNSSGEIASSELTFMRTKLDGSSTDVYFTLGSLAAEYRIAEKDGTVYIVYYDSVDSALKNYNTATGETVVIAKTDSEVDGVNGKSLASYKFASNGSLSSAIVVYTVTVYAEKYYEDKEGSRATEDYNLVYSYKLGDTFVANDTCAGTVILGDASVSATYETTLLNNEFYFYKETKDSSTKMFAVTTDKLGAKIEESAKTRIYNEEAVATTSVIVSLDEVYTVSEGNIFKTTLKQEFNAQKVKVAIAANASTLITVKDGFVYYYDASNRIARMLLSTENANEEIVSEDTTATTWYAPQFVTLGTDEYLFYLDNSSQGNSYVEYIKITGATAIGEDTDDDGEDDLYKLSGHKQLGVKLTADKITEAEAVIGTLSNELKDGRLVYETNSEGKLTVKAVTDMREYYSNLSSSVKEGISESTVNILTNYEKAIEMANLYKKVEKAYDDNVNKTELIAAYNEIKTAIEAFEDSDNFSVVSSYLEKNMLANYAKAKSFAEEAAA